MMFFEVLKLLFKKPFTNKFPVKYAPKNTLGLIEKVQKGEVKINPPVDTPPGFRGKLEYDIDECVGCGLCAQVCPSHAIELVRDKKWIILHCKDGAKMAAPLKIRIYVSRCVFCGQCVDICPRKCLRMSDEFLLANEDKLAENLIIPRP